MKFGVSSYSFAHYMDATGCDYLKICELAKQIGYDAIEFIDLSEDVSHRPVMDTAKEIADTAAKLGLEVAAYTVGANLLTEDIQAEEERLKGCVDVAQALGAKVMRHDCCWKPRERARYTWQDAIAETAPHIRAITEYAQSKGIVTCTENHGTFMQDSRRVEALMQAVNHPNYGWLVDIGNFICADESSIQAVATAAPYAVHVHAKDFLFKSGGECDPGDGWFKSRGGNYLRGTILGHGVIPVAQCLQMLQSAGYNGTVSVEFEGMEENIPALEIGLKYLKNLNLK